MASAELPSSEIGLHKPLACAACRAAKVKCRPAEEGTSKVVGEVCARCVKLQLSCEYTARRKRRKKMHDQGEAVPSGSASTSTPQAAATTASPDTGHSRQQQYDVIGSRSTPTYALARREPDQAGQLASEVPAELTPGATVFFPGFHPIPSFMPGSALDPDYYSLHGPAAGITAGPPSSAAVPSAVPRTTQSRRTATMSFKQELRELRDGLGIPATRDVSRNGSPDLGPGDRFQPQAGSDRSVEANLGQDALGMETMAAGPDLPGLLSATEVAYLFERFFACHNTCVGLLDSVLHTPSYTSSTSSALFCAILAVTAGTFRPERYPELWQRAKAMVNLAFASAEESVELCQAVSLLSVWNDVEDSSGPLRFGFAVRIAYQIGLDRPIERPLPHDQLAARLELNRERTWLHLASYEIAVNALFGGIPSMIDSDPLETVKVWYADHPHQASATDVVLLANSEIAPIISSNILPKSRELSSAERQERLERARSLRVEWTLTWLGPRPPGGPLSRGIKAYLKFIEKALTRETCEMASLTAGPVDKSECLWSDIYAAMDSLRQLTADTTSEGIIFWGSNSIAMHASKCGLLLTKHICKLTALMAEGVMTMFHELYRASAAHAAEGTRRHYLRRLFGRMLRISRARLAGREKGDTVVLSQDPSTASQWAPRLESSSLPLDATPGPSLSGGREITLGMAPTTVMDPWFGGTDASWFDLQDVPGFNDQQQLEALVHDYAAHFFADTGGVSHASIQARMQ